MTSSSNQTGWQLPNGFSCGISVVNGLTRSKTEFRPSNGRRVTWYICGPTVYDVSHIGHARTYLAFDIVRRILSDYFHYDVFMVMNITDIDDKIIIKSKDLGVSFMEVARQYEADFLEDMTSLGVRPPDVLTRVSEYVPQIIQYIERIIANGFAYDSNGSVYFDVGKFSSDPSHSYAKLQPNAIGDASLLQEGEGALSSAYGSEKRSPGDFALWKRSKEGEPSWDSPWGPGRPGWHIECSAMASDIIGEKMDVHAGGVDLKFPHHDNELAQSEAYFKSDQWVNYFLHTGHLHIDGLKMAKSLKNFITIKAALQKYSARQIRFLFLVHRYDAPLEYSENTMERAVMTDRMFAEFFLNVKAALRQADMNYQMWSQVEKDLFNSFLDKKDLIHKALQDNFNTPQAMSELSELVRLVNVYLARPPPARFPPYIVRSIASYITSMFKIFGIITDSDIGFSGEGDQKSAEEVLTPFLTAFSSFRDTVRTAARSKDMTRVLAACDTIRDETMPDLGVRLEDTPSGISVWKLEDKETLLREKQRKKEAEVAKAAEKARKLQEEKDKAAKKEAQAAIEPSAMFRSLSDQYSQFDEQGVPTHGADGQPLSKSARKGVLKQYETQVKLHEAYLAKKVASSTSTNGIVEPPPVSQAVTNGAS